MYLQPSLYENDTYLSRNFFFRKHTVGEGERRDTRIYMNLLNLGVNLPTENREHILMNSEAYIYM